MPVSIPAVPMLPPEPGASECPVSLATEPVTVFPESVASGSERLSPLPLFVPGEKVMTSAAALFLLIAAAGLPRSGLGMAGAGVPGLDWLITTISGVGFAW
jgi:hypothetical protein